MSRLSVTAQDVGDMHITGATCKVDPTTSSVSTVATFGVVEYPNPKCGERFPIMNKEFEHA